MTCSVVCPKTETFHDTLNIRHLTSLRTRCTDSARRIAQESRRGDGFSMTTNAVGGPTEIRANSEDRGRGQNTSKPVT